MLGWLSSGGEYDGTYCCGASVDTGSDSTEICDGAVVYMGRLVAPVDKSDMVAGGEVTYEEEPLSALLWRCEILESRRAWSRWRLSSRCSAVRIALGGLPTTDLVGGVKLTSEVP